MASDTRYYVRDSDDHVLDKRWHDYGVDNPAEWSGIGTTHRVEQAPGGENKPDHLDWKIVTGAWVALSQEDLDTNQLVLDKMARDAAITALEHSRSAAQAIVGDTGSYSQAVRDAQQTCATDCEAKLASHNTNYGSLWVKGTNP